MGVQQNKIFHSEERSHAASETRWGLLDNQDERFMEDIRDIHLECVTLDTGANIPILPMYKGITKKRRDNIWACIWCTITT